MTDILDCKYRNLSQFIKILRYLAIYILSPFITKFACLIDVKSRYIADKQFTRVSSTKIRIKQIV